MNRARFAVAPGETVTAFAVGPLENRYYPGPVEVMEDRVDYKFVNGWTDVGDLPCRKATWNDIATRPTPPLPDITGTEVTLPGFNRRLDFSGFWHIPHRLSRAAKTRLMPQNSGDVRFTLTTCGGVNIWVDGRHAVGFEPFTRNKAQTTEVTLPLSAEGSDVLLLVEEMAERDSVYFAELTWHGPGELITEVPGNADPEALTMLMALARDVRPSQVSFGATDKVCLEFDNAPDTEVTIAAAVHPSVHLSHKPPIWAAHAKLASGSRQANFGMTSLPDGYHSLALTLSIGETQVTRSIGLAVLKEPRAMTLAATLPERKAEALEHATRHGEPRTGKLLAKIATGLPWDDDSSEIMADTLDGITRRRDCSDFVLVPLLWLLAEYQDALPEDVAVAAKDAVLGYRYWMTEPGNDAMWFWSENHVLCFHVSQYLAGRLYPDETFPNSGKTGSDHEAEGAERLNRWFDAIERDGLAEWNSAAYYPVDFIGVFALAQLADGTIRTRARRLLDQLFTMIALHTIGGVSAGSMGRAYDKELRAGPLTELSPFAAVAWGKGWLNNGVASLPLFCLSDYEPPDGLAALAAPKAPVQAHYVQGHGTQGRLALHKTPHMQLSAAIDGAPGAGGHQQHLVDAQSAAAPFARAWINHPGQDDPWGSNRPSYWAGNGRMPRVGMSGETALLLFDTEEAGTRYWTHAYAPVSAFDAFELGDDFLVLLSGRGCLVLKATGPIAPVTSGPGTGIEWRCDGQRTGWAMIIGDVPAGGMADLAASARAMTLSLTGDALTLSRPDAPELELDWAKGLFENGKHRPFPTDATRPVVKHPASSASPRPFEQTA